MPRRKAELVPCRCSVRHCQSSQVHAGLHVCVSPFLVYGGRTFLTAEQLRVVDHAVSATARSVDTNASASATAKERRQPRKRARSR